MVQAPFVQDEGLTATEMASPLTMGDLVTALSLIAGPDFPPRAWHNIIRSRQSTITTTVGTLITGDGAGGS
ncbi:hypothetical protein NLJ89_g11826 [Agrocybe chaxingu]|uniref:Uncharacterized protein n=1 Tax=Agrocybe chaxingu TaxID=84603 RepID=A0A9W8JNM3_9AGAR|nr:hypothetical protein NLJ89_g11826 [Agrocybe chaxingu]